MVNSQLEQFADQGFHYGRDWLKGQVYYCEEISVIIVIVCFISPTAGGVSSQCIW